MVRSLGSACPVVSRVWEVNHIVRFFFLKIWQFGSVVKLIEH